MRTEDQLQTRVGGTLYLLGAAVMLLLSIQNYRYGLYDLVYSASMILTILLALGIYSQFAWERPQLLRASLTGLSACLLLIAFDSLEYADEVNYWAFPIILLCFVALRHKQAMIIATMTLIALSLSALANEHLLTALSFATAMCLVIALASTYAKLQQQRNRTLVELAIRDPLTNAYNYRHLEDTLGKEICRAQRTGKSLSLICLEIDYFPQIVDLHGNQAVQELLKHLADSLDSMIRAGDSQYFNGDHSYYLMLPCTPPEGLVVIAERIRRSISEASWPVVESITVSLGCTSYTEDSANETASSVINQSHIALVEAQKNGHNRVCHH